MANVAPKTSSESVVAAALTPDTKYQREPTSRSRACTPDAQDVSVPSALESEPARLLSSPRVCWCVVICTRTTVSTERVKQASAVSVLTLSGWPNSINRSPTRGEESRAVDTRFGHSARRTRGAGEPIPFGRVLLPARSTLSERRASFEPPVDPAWSLFLTGPRVRIQRLAQRTIPLHRHCFSFLVWTTRSSSTLRRVCRGEHQNVVRWRAIARIVRIGKLENSRRVCCGSSIRAVLSFCGLAQQQNSGESYGFLLSREREVTSWGHGSGVERSCVHQ